MTLVALLITLLITARNRQVWGLCPGSQGIGAFKLRARGVWVLQVASLVGLGWGLVEDCPSWVWSWVWGVKLNGPKP